MEIKLQGSRKEKESKQILHKDVCGARVSSHDSGRLYSGHKWATKSFILFRNVYFRDGIIPEPGGVFGGETIKPKFKLES